MHISHKHTVLSLLAVRIHMYSNHALPFLFTCALSILQVQAFAAVLESRKITVSVRQTRGLDASAACGQLRNEFQKSPLVINSDSLESQPENVAVACWCHNIFGGYFSNLQESCCLITRLVGASKHARYYGVIAEVKFGFIDDANHTGFNEWGSFCRILGVLGLWIPWKLIRWRVEDKLFSMIFLFVPRRERSWLLYTSTTNSVS